MGTELTSEQNKGFFTVFRFLMTSEALLEELVFFLVYYRITVMFHDMFAEVITWRLVNVFTKLPILCIHFGDCADVIGY